MILAVSGSKYFKDYRNSEFILNDFMLSDIFDNNINKYQITKLVHSGEIGFAACVEKYFQKTHPHIEIVNIKSQYVNSEHINIHNRSASIKRNQDMIQLADILITCKNHEKSKCTRNILHFARLKNIIISEFSYSF